VYAEVSINRAREDCARDTGHRGGLSRTARASVAAAGRRRHPEPLPVIRLECEHSTAAGRFERANYVVGARRAIARHLEIGESDEYLRAIRREAPLNSTQDTPFPTRACQSSLPGASGATACSIPDFWPSPSTRLPPAMRISTGEAPKSWSGPSESGQLALSGRAHVLL